MPSIPATAARAYAITPVATLLNWGLCRAERAAPAEPAPEPMPPYGDLPTPIPGGKRDADPVLRVFFPNARVHGAEGVVTIGRYVVQETLFDVLPARVHAWQEGSLWLTLHDYVGAHLPAAEHLLCGASSNYAHWLLEGLSRWSLMPDPTIPIIVPAGAPFHEGAALLPGHRAYPLAPGQVVSVGMLAWTTPLSGRGGAYHPALNRFGAAMRAVVPTSGSANIYISRRDAAQRPLRNETDVERLCRDRGFTSVQLTGMPVPDQVALFAAARRIVAPHGAGLANLVFCRPGAAVLELVMDQYANFCFRRLAACMDLRYGGITGQADPGGDADWVHGTAWTMDPDRLAAALDDPAFAPQEP